MTLRLKLKLTNATDPAEIAAALENVAAKIRGGGFFDEPIVDIRGNKVGKFTFTVIADGP